MAEYDVQDAIERLREEIQTDRLATMDRIQDGFNRMSDKFSEHAREDEEAFSALTQRVTDMERTTKVIGGGLVAVILAAMGTAFNWLVGK